MITYVTGDIFKSPAKVLVNPVNTEGVMGKGLAKSFKTLFPEMFPKYQELCEKQLLTVGKLWIFKTENKWVLNFPTKTTWRQPSKVEYIELGLIKFKETYAKFGITSVSFPKIGCGNGELSWEKDVRPLMLKHLASLPIDVFIHLHDEIEKQEPEHTNPIAMKKWLRTEPQYLSVDEVKQDLISSALSHLSVKNIETGKEFSFEFSDEASRIIFSPGSYLSYSELFELWATMRRYGFVSKQVVSAPVLEAYGFVLGMLLTLDYCALVKVTDRYKDFLDKNNSNWGIQFVPKSNHSVLKSITELEVFNL